MHLALPFIQDTIDVCISGSWNHGKKPNVRNMLMGPEWRNRTLVGVALLFAVIGAVQIAQGSLAWALLGAAGAFGLVLRQIQPVPLPTLVLGTVLFGYIVGNRGFAQLSLVGNSPLLPAEIALLISTVLIVLQCALKRELPFRYEPLNTAIGLWILLGTVRVVFDVKAYGFMAIRDFALVYYALFFFVAQYLARNPISFRFLLRCIYFSTVTLVILQPLYQWQLDFFLTKLTVRNIPLIYYKGDLLSTFLAMTSLVFFLRFEASRTLTSFAVSIGALLPVFSSDNRASLLGLAGATALLAIGRRWRFAFYQVAGGIFLSAVLLLFAAARDQPLESTAAFKFYERVISIADPGGQHAYRGVDTLNKGENNAFRTIWWKSAIEETMENNPWTGLGFGHDLAQRFMDRYYPTGNDDFTARSPHNFIVTVFARMGLVGLFPFLVIVALVGWHAVKAVRHSKERVTAPSLWCSVWIIMISACFGVVLEGPMGAVVFWSLLGLAHADSSKNLAESPSPPDQSGVPTEATGAVRADT